MIYQPAPKQQTRRQRGQSLVEVSLSLMLLLTMFSGIVDLGRAYIASVALQDAANEAALYLAIEPNCRYVNDNGGDPECDDPNNAEYRARNAGGGELDWSRAEITVTRYGFGTGDPVKVTIRYRFALITPIVSQLLSSDSIMLGANATHIIISE